MAYINQTPFKVVDSPAKVTVTHHGPLHVEPARGPRKVPLPLDDSEGFFFHHSPVNFTITSRVSQYAASEPGFVYITSHRLVLLAAKASPTFESLAVSLGEVYSLRSAWTVNPRVAAVHIDTIDGDHFKIEITFESNDRPRCQIFKDYLKMVMETVAASYKKQPDVAENLTSATVLREIQLAEEMPPAYRELVGAHAAAAGARDVAPPSYYGLS